MTSLFDKVSTAKELKESDDFAGGFALECTRYFA